MTRLLRLSKNRPIFRHLHNKGSAAHPGHVSLIGISDNRKEQFLANTAGEVGLPIQTFPNRFSPVLQCVAERCHAAKLFCRVSARIATVFPSMFGLNASIVVDNDIP